MPLISIKRVTFYVSKGEITIFFKTSKDFTVKCVAASQDIKENHLSVPKKISLSKSAITHVNDNEYESDINKIEYIF